MPGKIIVENAGQPGKAYAVDRDKYTAMRGVVLAVCPAGPPGMTPADLIRAVAPHLPGDLFPGGATAGWWVKCVQLDLEAKGLLARAAKSPVRLWKL